MHQNNRQTILQRSNMAEEPVPIQENEYKEFMHKTHSVPAADSNMLFFHRGLRSLVAITSPFSTAPSVRRVRTHPSTSSSVLRKTAWIWNWHLKV